MTRSEPLVPFFHSPPPRLPGAEGFHLKVARAQAFRLQSTLYRFPKDKAEKLISITNVERLHFSATERSVNPGGPGAGDEELALNRHVVPTHSLMGYGHSHVQHPAHTHASHMRRLKFQSRLGSAVIWLVCCLAWTSRCLQGSSPPTLLPPEVLEMAAQLKLSSCSDLNMVLFPKWRCGGRRTFKKQGLRLGKCLPHKHEGLSLDPITHTRKPSMEASVIPATGEIKTSPPTPAHCPVNLA